MHEANAYDATEALGGRTFNVVYTSIGAITWHHGIGEVISALAQAGLRIEFLHEYPYAPRAFWPFLERKADRTCHMPADRFTG